jgi:hypothetical protein
MLEETGQNISAKTGRFDILRASRGARRSAGPAEVSHDPCSTRAAHFSTNLEENGQDRLTLWTFFDGCALIVAGGSGGILWRGRQRSAEIT